MSVAEEYQLNPYLGWQKEQGIPIHTGFFVEDLRKVRLGFWQARNANGAFINLSNAVVNDGSFWKCRREKRRSRAARSLTSLSWSSKAREPLPRGTKTVERKLSSGNKAASSRSRLTSGMNITP